MPNRRKSAMPDIRYTDPPLPEDSVLNEDEVLFAEAQKFMILRHYQGDAVSVERIHGDKDYGFVRPTTCSEKSPTPFRASTLLNENDPIQECVFAGDLKALDRQTREDLTASGMDPARHLPTPP